MCESQRALQIVMESTPATRWSKHCKHVMELCWNVLRMRHEEVLVDITFLTAAKYFNLILPLNNQGMRKRLNRHLLHFYVTLLRTAATDHDHVLLFEAVHTMLPYMDTYNAAVGHEDGPMGPAYVNYVRKTIMDQLESLNPTGASPSSPCMPACPGPPVGAPSQCCTMAHWLAVNIVRGSCEETRLICGCVQRRCARVSRMCGGSSSATPTSSTRIWRTSTRSSSHACSA